MTDESKLPALPESFCHVMRRKGAKAPIGLLPNRIAALPPKQAEYLRDFEELPVYTAAQMHAYASQAVAAVAEDAARYRWLRSTQRFKHYLDGELVREEPIDPAVYDAAIDTAIAEAHEAVDAAIDAAMQENDHAR